MKSVHTHSPASLKALAVNDLIAIWVAVSPFVLGARHNAALLTSNVIVGVALLIVSVAGEWIDSALEALVVPLGIWLFASPFVLGFPTTAMAASNVLAAITAIAVAAMTDEIRFISQGRFFTQSR